MPGVALTALLALTACSNAPAPIERYYRPEIAAPEPHTPLPLRMLVELFEVHGLYSDRPLVYLDGEGAYRQSHFHNWLEAPSQLLGESLLGYLRAAYGAESAFLPDARLEGDLTIRSRLRRFERIPGTDSTHLPPTNSPISPQALLALEIVVTARSGRLLGSIDFEESAAAGTTIPEYVRAQSALLGKAYGQLLILLDTRAAASATDRKTR